MPVGDRILGLAVGDDEADAAVQTKLRAISVLLLIHQVAETAFLYTSAPLPRRELLPVLALVYLALMVWGLFSRWTRTATTVCALLHAHHDFFRYRRSGDELTGGHYLRTLVVE